MSEPVDAQQVEPMTAEELEQALTRIDREESIAYGRIAVLLPANLLVAVMGAVDPLSQAINDALQLDLATLDAARAAPEIDAARWLTETRIKDIREAEDRVLGAIRVRLDHWRTHNDDIGRTVAAELAAALRYDLPDHAEPEG